MYSFFSFTVSVLLSEKQTIRRMPMSTEKVKSKVDFKWDRADPCSKFSYEQFKAILDSECETPLDEATIKAYWDQYGKTDTIVKLILNKAQGLAKDMAKVTSSEEMILLGSRDHVYKKEDDEGNVKFAKPFQSFVSTYFVSKGTLGQTALKGSPKLKQKGIVWGKKSKVGVEEETSTTAKGTFKNLYIKKASDIDEKTILDDYLKKLYILPENITEEMAEKYQMVCLYGELGQFVLETVYESEDNYIEQPIYVEATDKSGEKMPCFKVTLRSPVKKEGETRKVIYIHFRPQHFGRNVFDMEGWSEKQAERIASLESEKQVDELNSFWGNGQYRVFVIGSMSKYKPSDDGSSIFIELNGTYIKQTDFKPTQALDSKDVAERSKGKPTISIKDIRENIKKKVTQAFDDLGADASFDALKQVGCFKDAESIEQPTLVRMVENFQIEYIEKKKGEKKSEPSKETPKETPKEADKPKEDSKKEEPKKEEPKKEESKKPEEPKNSDLTITEADLKKIESHEKEILGGGFSLEEVSVMLKDMVKKELGVDKFMIYKSTRMKELLTNYNPKAKPEPKPEPKKAESKPEIKKPEVKLTKDQKWAEFEGNMVEIDLPIPTQQIAQFIFNNGGFEGNGVKRIKIFSEFDGKIAKDVIEKAIQKLFDVELIKESAKNTYIIV